MSSLILLFAAALMTFISPVALQQAQLGARVMTVEYRVEFPDATCSNATPPFPLNLTTERFSNVLTVMERAADVGSTYRFSATYFSNTLGYFIDAISNVESNNPCFWILYIQEPNGSPTRANLGVSNFFIRRSGFTVIWRFESI